MGERCGANENAASLWSAATGACLRRLTGHSDTVWGAAFSPDGAVIATASEDATVRTWQAATGAAVATLEGHGGSVFMTAFSPDGRVLASASYDGTVRLWEAATGRGAGTLTGHAGAVNSVAFSPEGTLVATASADGSSLRTRVPGRAGSSASPPVAVDPTGRRAAGERRHPCYSRVRSG